ncbi:hypothetical protein ACTXT7_001731 [Hymenolepis weldensis]
MQLSNYVRDTFSQVNLSTSIEDPKDYVKSVDETFATCLRSPCHDEIQLRHLSLLDKKPDVKKSRRRPKSARGLEPTPHPTIIRRISKAATLKMPILQRTSLSSRLPYRICRCQNCNDNGHEEDFHRESSMNSSARRNPNNKGALTQMEQSYGRHWLQYLMLCNSTYRCDARLYSQRRRSSGSATLQIENINQMGLDWIDELNLIQCGTHYGDKFTFERVRCYSTSRSAIAIFHKLVVYQKRSLRTQVHNLNLHFAKFCSDRSIIQLRRSLAVLGQSASAAELRGQDLRTACEEMLLSKQLYVPTKCDPMRAYSVGDLVYALNHNLNHQWTAAIITKPHGGDIYDVETRKNT